MYRPLAQRPRSQTLPRISQLCEFVTAPRPYVTLGHSMRRAKPLQGLPKAGLILKQISRSHRFGPSKPTKQTPAKEAQTGLSKAEASAKPHQDPQVGAQDVVVVVENARDQLLAHSGIPSEQEVLAALRKCKKAASLLHDVPAKHLSRTAVETDTAASSLLSLDGSETELTRPRDTKVPETLRPSELIDRLSEAAFDIISHPTVIITPQVLDIYVETQARLGRVETLPHVFSLYASKPKPQGSPGELQYAKQDPDKSVNAIDSEIVEKALDATIEARNLDAAIGVIENGYATKAFFRAKLLKRAQLPASVAVATPLAVYFLASNLSHLQDAVDEKTATAVATLGILGYIGITGWVGVLAVITQGDHMKRVTWAPGIPLKERWFHEEERAALDKVACSFGFSQALRFGEEEGAEFRALREFILTRGMVLDRVEAMPGMS